MLHIVKSLVIIIPDDHDHCHIIDLWSYTIIIIIQFYHNYYMMISILLIVMLMILLDIIHNNWYLILPVTMTGHHYTIWQGKNYP